MNTLVRKVKWPAQGHRSRVNIAMLTPSPDPSTSPPSPIHPEEPPLPQTIFMISQGQSKGVLRPIYPYFWLLAKSHGVILERLPQTLQVIVLEVSAWIRSRDCFLHTANGAVMGARFQGSYLLMCFGSLKNVHCFYPWMTHEGHRHYIESHIQGVYHSIGWNGRIPKPTQLSINRVLMK